MGSEETRSDDARLVVPAERRERESTLRVELGTEDASRELARVLVDEGKSLHRTFRLERRVRLGEERDLGVEGASAARALHRRGR